MSYSNLVLNLINTLPNIDCVDDEGNNICHHLAKYGDKKILNKMFKNYKPNWKSLLNKRNDEGDTPLHIAVKNNNILVNEFIKLGADKNISDIHGHVITLDKNSQKGGGINQQKIKGKRIL